MTDQTEIPIALSPCRCKGRPLMGSILGTFHVLCSAPGCGAQTPRMETEEGAVGIWSAMQQDPAVPEEK